MANIKCLSIFLLVAFLVTACQPTPAVINHPAPTLTTDYSAFVEAGCAEGASTCELDQFLADFGCNQISPASNYLGGLSPAYPIALCEVQPYAEESAAVDLIQGKDYFYNSGGLFPVYIRYLIARDGEFQLIRNLNELRDIYAPIETPEEALSYALAATDLSAYYGLERNPDYKYEVETLEDTHVETTEGGYLLHLYDYQVFGCGPHWTSTVDVQVTTDGALTILDQDHVYRDPTHDNLCVD
jgi:hypothetical protein